MEQFVSGANESMIILHTSQVETESMKLHQIQYNNETILLACCVKLNKNTCNITGAVIINV